MPRDNELIGALLAIAYDAESAWIQDADVEQDFPENADLVAKAACYREYGELGERYGFTGELERWTSLAKNLLTHTDEPEDDKPTTALICTDCSHREGTEDGLTDPRCVRLGHNYERITE